MKLLYHRNIYTILYAYVDYINALTGCTHTGIRQNTAHSNKLFRYISLSVIIGMNGMINTLRVLMSV